jgi:hypothetical protein
MTGLGRCRLLGKGQRSRSSCTASLALNPFLQADSWGGGQREADQREVNNARWQAYQSMHQGEQRARGERSDLNNLPNVAR